MVFIFSRKGNTDHERQRISEGIRGLYAATRRFPAPRTPAYGVAVSACRGIQKIADGIRRFAAANGADNKYHETITVFWARMVSYAISCAPEIADFDVFIETFPHLLDSTLLKRHYSVDVIRSEAARRAWIAPDVIPMPAPLSE
jgi:hypothetical protein